MTSPECQALLLGSGDSKPEYEPSSPPYSYLPISDKDTVRVLELSPSHNFKAPLEARLLEMNLDGRTSYDALSYTWGTSNQHGRPIKILAQDGPLSLKVKPNLYHALRQMRYEFVTRLVWVDAICINQGDKDEKASQIPLMEHIYRRASSVFVWLGVKPRVAGDLLYVDHISRGIRMPLNKQRNHISISEAIRHLSGHAWFRRRWIVQEVALNANVTMCCGGIQIPWMRLVQFLESSKTWADANLSPVYFLCKLWQDLMTNKRAIAPVELLEDFRDSDCQDPRDRLFALAGLIELAITPSYQTTFADIYIKFAEAQIQRGRLHEILRAASCRSLEEDESEIPSWVPDWRARWCCNPIRTSHGDFVDITGSQGYINPSESRWLSSAEAQSYAATYKPSVKAFMDASVAHNSNRSYSLNLPRRSNLKKSPRSLRERSIQGVVEHMGERFPAVDTDIAIFQWMDETTKAIYEMGRPAGYWRYYSSCWEQLLMIIAPSYHNLKDLAPTPQEGHVTSDSSSDRIAADRKQDFLRHVRYTMKGRRVFLVNFSEWVRDLEGPVLGIGPAQTKKSDKLLIEGRGLGSANNTSHPKLVQSPLFAKIERSASQEAEALRKYILFMPETYVVRKTIAYSAATTGSRLPRPSDECYRLIGEAYLCVAGGAERSIIERLYHYLYHCPFRHLNLVPDSVVRIV
ncbi:heterokaryon incompatibility protein-domain-containing protein [Xylariomycetidae sp. FL0641]|nr:heterokaryon incompatibility protein-domain-containing protein [Xylariomycetidae sp. FL0641]